MAVAVIALLLGTLAGCSGASTPAPSATVTVSGAWVRVAQTTDTPTAAYLVITNLGSQPDTLTAVTSPAAGTIEMHETAMDSSGMSGMHPVQRLDVPAGATVRLQPGSFHLMVMGLRKPLVAGGTVELDLTFEHAGHVVVQADIRAS